MPDAMKPIRQVIRNFIHRAGDAAGPHELVGQRTVKLPTEVPPPISPQELDRMPAERRAMVLQRENYQLRTIISKLQGELERALAERQSLLAEHSATQERLRRLNRELFALCEQLPGFVAYRSQVRPGNLTPEAMISFVRQEVSSLLREQGQHELARLRAEVHRLQAELQLLRQRQGQEPPPSQSPQPAEPHRAVVDPQEALRLAEYIKRLDDLQRQMLLLIGRTGCARINDIMKRPEVDEQLFGGRHGVARCLNDLRAMGLLESERVNTGARGMQFYVFWLSEKGKNIYRMLSGEDPVPSEVEILTAQHASLEHGYLVKIAAEILSDQGYAVKMDRQDCTFYVKDEEGKPQRLVYDLVAVDPQGKELYIEVERGTSSDKDFFEKLDKIYAHVSERTKEIHIIAASDVVMHKDCKGRFNEWVLRHRGGREYVDVAAYFTTIERLRNRDWECINLRKPDPA